MKIHFDQPNERGVGCTNFRIRRHCLSDFPNLWRRILKFVHPTPAFCLALLAASASAAEIEGFTEPHRTIDVAAVESGIIIDVLVKEGDKVTKDQPLAELNQDVLKATLEIARAQRDATSALKSAEAELKLRADRLDKLKILRDRGNASEEEVFRADLEHEVAAAHVLAAKENHEIKSLDHDRIRLQLNQRTVKSTIDGFVTHIHRDTGEFVAPTDPIVMTIVQLDPLAVVFSVPASVAANFQPNQSLPVRINGEKKLADSKIEIISPVINAESQTVRVRVLIPNPGYKYRSGAKSFLEVPGLPEKPTAPTPRVTTKPVPAAKPVKQ
ncbi:MAG: efflux RND transporter periplasmic adaptor subunit [Planctomycetaceae bacterium]